MMVIIIGALIAVAVLLLAGGSQQRLRALLSRTGADPDPLAQPNTDQNVRRSTDTKGQPSTDTKAQPGAETLAFELDLVAVCLHAGLPPAGALLLAAEATGDACGLARVARGVALGAVELAPDDVRAPVASLVEFSQYTGVPLAPLISAQAGDLRAEQRRKNRVAAAELGVKLVVPLGVCILPAFVLLAVVPVVMSLMNDFAGVF